MHTHCALLCTRLWHLITLNLHTKKHAVIQAHRESGKVSSKCTNAVPRARDNLNPPYALAAAQRSLIKLTLETLEARDGIEAWMQLTHSKHDHICDQFTAWSPAGGKNLKHVRPKWKHIWFTFLSYTIYNAVFMTVLKHRMSYQQSSYRLISITLKLYSFHSCTNCLCVQKLWTYRQKNKSCPRTCQMIAFLSNLT